MHSLPRAMDRPGRRLACTFTGLPCRPLILMAARDDHAEPGDEFTGEGAAAAVRPADHAGPVVSGRGRGGGGLWPCDPRARPGLARGAAGRAAGRLGADRPAIPVPT